MTAKKCQNSIYIDFLCVFSRYLLSRGADVRLLTRSNQNILHLAANNGNIDLWKKVVAECKRVGVLDQMVNAKDRYNGVEICFLIRGTDRGR